MLEDLEEQFTLDQRRIYSTGFSGGSRFAIPFAIKEKKISNIIDCGAGLLMTGIISRQDSDFLY